MRIKSAPLVGALSLAGVLSGVASGLLLSQHSQPESIESRQITASSISSETPTAPVFDVNSAGETFGSLADSTGVDDAPDLVSVEVEGGGAGYVRSSELFAAEGLFDNPSSPAEALALQESRARGGDIALTAYAEDGVTVVGTFVVQTGLDQ